MKKSLIILIVFFFAGTIRASLFDGLIAYWTLDETTGFVYSEEVNGLDGICSVNISGVTVAGHKGNAYYITTTDVSVYQAQSIVGVNEMTIAFWLKRGAVYEFGFANGQVGLGYSLACYFANEIGQTDFVINTSPAAWSNNTIPNDNNFHSVILTYDKNATPSTHFYLDSNDLTLYYSEDGLVLPTLTDSVLYFSQALGGGECVVDEPAVWNRVLSSGERGDWINNGIPIEPNNCSCKCID